MGMPLPEIPRDLSAVTAGWLDRILRSSGILAGARIRDFEIEKLGEGEGFMGETARLHLAYAGSGEVGLPSVVLKIPTSDRKLRAAGEALGIYERESFFYQQLAGQMPVRVPRCYFTAMDARPFGSPEQDAVSLERLEQFPRWGLAALVAAGPWLARISRRRYVLLLEDLAPARLGNQVTETSEEDIRGAIASLARIHAHAWENPAVENVPWLHPIDSTTKMNEYLVARQRPHFEELFAAAIPEYGKPHMDWLEENIGAIQRRLAKPPCTLLHGDYRLDNLFFDDTAADSLAIVSDWQVPSWGRGVCDLAYFLSGTLEADLPVEAAFPHVDFYHEQIRKLRSIRYDREECRRDYVRALYLVLSRVVSSFGEIEPSNDRAVTLFRLWVGRAFSRLRGVDPASVLQ